jgi:hypothetical protein
MEFGYRGDGPSNLIVPDDLAIDTSGNVYIGQAANRGVSVFQVVHHNVSNLDHQNASESKATNATSTGSEKSGEVFEEFVSEREEFIVDLDDNAAETGSDKPYGTLDNNETHHEKDDENDRN